MEQQIIKDKKSLIFTIIISTILLTNMLQFAIGKCTGYARAQISDETGSSELYMSEGSSNLFINELMADNGITTAGPDGNSPDWIELFNAGDKTIDLTGMYLTDDLNDPTCWQFPEGTTIGPREYLIVWADRDGGKIYASFGLNANGEEVGLFDSDGETLIDSVEFVKQIEDVSYGRIPDGGSSWNYLVSATPGSSNIDPSVETKSSVESLVILIIVLAIAVISIFLASKINEIRNK